MTHADAISRLQDVNNRQKLASETFERTQEALETLSDSVENNAIANNRFAKQMKTVADKLNDFRNSNPAQKQLYYGEALMRVGEALMQFRDAIYKTQAKLGVTFDTSINALAGAYTNVITSYFSKGPQLNVEDTINAINAYQKEFGTILTRGAAKDFAQTAKKFGTDMDTLAKAQRSFLGAGGFANQAKVQQQFITQFKNAGLTANQALAFAANNANLVAIAGVKYADALSRAAANATRIGVSLDKTEQFADTLVGDFEGALERFSELRAMGVEVDFNKLAQVAGTGSPEQVQKELAAQFGGNQQLLNELQRNRFLKVSLERDLGLDIAEITRLAKGEGAVPVEKTQEEKIENGINQGIIKGLGPLTFGVGALISVINPQTAAILANTAALIANMGGMGKFMSVLGTAGKFGLGAAGVGIGVGGALAGRELVKEGQTGLGIGMGSIAGLVGGGLLALATGGAALPFLLGGAALGGGISASGLIGQGKAEGGLITGTGTPTSDRILTPSSPGEFVINANATKNYGTDFLNAVNKTSYDPQQPVVNNTVNVAMDKLESKLDRLASAFSAIKIEMDGNTVGRVSLNARSPIDRLAVVG
jgi:uncharacterized coiled-coil protein SlyX